MLSAMVARDKTIEGHKTMVAQQQQKLAVLHNYHDLLFLAMQFRRDWLEAREAGLYGLSDADWHTLNAFQLGDYRQALDETIDEAVKAEARVMKYLGQRLILVSDRRLTQ